MTNPRNRLSDRIIDAFDLACDQKHVEAADGLFRILELVLTRRPGSGHTDNRQDVEDIRRAGLRLAELKHK